MTGQHDVMKAIGQHGRQDMNKARGQHNRMRCIAVNSLSYSNPVYAASTRSSCPSCCFPVSWPVPSATQSVQLSSTADSYWA